MSARILVVDDSPTLRKLVAAILSRHGYRVDVAPDGEAALAQLRAAPADLVLLDFVMPGMDGYQVCRAMRADPLLGNTPVVVMSAVADRVRGHFLNLTGAIDAISKPFDPGALVAIVEGVLARVDQGRVRPHPPLADMPLEWSDVPSSRHAEREDPGVHRARSVRALGRAIADAVTDAVAALDDGAARDPQAIAAAVEHAITPERAEVLALRLRTLDLGDGARDVLSADLSAISLAEILQVLHYERQTGLLTVTSRRGEVTIALREGLVDLALGRGLGDGLRLGRQFVEKGLVARPDVEQVLKLRAGSKRLVGETLVHFGMVGDDALRAALERQTEELVYEALRFRNGRLVFSRNATRPEAEAARLALPVAPIVMEGFRRIDEWRQIEHDLPADLVLVRRPIPPAPGAVAKLGALERAVLERVDGRRPVREVLLGVEASPFEAGKALRDLLVGRFLAGRAP